MKVKFKRLRKEKREKKWIGHLVSDNGLLNGWATQWEKDEVIKIERKIKDKHDSRSKLILFHEFMLVRKKPWR